MNRVAIIIFCILQIPSVLHSQMSIIIDEVPKSTAENSIFYLASNINQWNPHHSDYIFTLNENNELLLHIDSLEIDDVVEFKITLGTWQITEVTSEGVDIENRSFVYSKADTIYIQVEGWSRSTEEKITNSASSNVEVINDEFYMPQLDRYRRIWVYLPPDYDVELDKDYALLYMHDGQNLFDNNSSFAGEWNVDEHLNSLFEQGHEVPIVVGIDNGGALRSNEYCFENNEEYTIKAEGEKYLAFINETLHPYIESHYRTKNERESIGIMGSSLGGLITCYGIMTYPDLFGLAGIFSPAYWINPKIYLNEAKSDSTFRIIQVAGSQESETMIKDVAILDSLFQSSYKNATIKSEIIEGGKHNEQFWSEQFSEAILFLYAK